MAIVNVKYMSPLRRTFFKRAVFYRMFYGLWGQLHSNQICAPPGRVFAHYTRVRVLRGPDVDSRCGNA